MNISYDIFDVADFPIVLTDNNFIIIYKNRLAAKLFGTLRKRSKITRHIRNFKSDIDFSDISELNIETGTQFTRALVLHLGENLFVFSFLSIYAFTSKLELAEHIKSSFGGDFMSFFCTAYKEYAKFESMSKTERANVPERAFPELAFLLSSCASSPLIKAEVYNIEEIISKIFSKISSSLGAFGLKAAQAESSEGTRAICYAKINLRFFTFIIFRMVYMAFKLSDDGKIYASLDKSNYPIAEITLSARASATAEGLRKNDFSELAKILPEFSFEFSLLQKLGFFDNSLYFTLENSVLKLRYRIKCATGSDFLFRSEPQEIRRRKLDKIIGEFLRKTKLLLSKK